MSKIKIKSVLKSKETNHVFEGSGIKNGSKITYNDNGIMTTVTLDETIYIERKKDYYMKLGFYKSKSIEGTYIIPEGKLKIVTETKNLKTDENSVIIEYILKINDTYIDDFELNLQYSIDT